MVFNRKLRTEIDAEKGIVLLFPFKSFLIKLERYIITDIEKTVK